MKAKYYKVGEKFTLKGVELEVAPTNKKSSPKKCKFCAIETLPFSCMDLECNTNERSDETDVIFIPTKK